MAERRTERRDNHAPGESRSMRLKLFIPTDTLVDAPVRKIIAEAENGSFCLLPRHIDFVAALVPGILIYTDADGVERFFAVDSGTLVKVGDEVRVSALNAVAGADLGELRRTVQESFEALEEHEREARSALARLEAGTLRRFFQTEEPV
jgi:F-type H+-transporting ATPase subunit epsilon